MRHICLSHETSLANASLKSALTNCSQPWTTDRSKRQGRKKEGREHAAQGSWALYWDTCMGLHVCMQSNLPEARAGAKSSSQPSPTSLQVLGGPSQRCLVGPRRTWSYLHFLQNPSNRSSLLPRTTRVSPPCLPTPCSQQVLPHQPPPRPPPGFWLLGIETACRRLHNAWPCYT